MYTVTVAYYADFDSSMSVHQRRSDNRALLETHLHTMHNVLLKHTVVESPRPLAVRTHYCTVYMGIQSVLEAILTCF